MSPQSSIREVSYCDTAVIGLALARRCPRLEFNLRSDAERVYVERDRKERVRPGIVVGGRLFPRRIRIQRPGEATLARVRRLVERGRAVVTRIDLARDVLLDTQAQADALHAAVRERVALAWCSTPMRVIEGGTSYLGVEPDSEGVEGTVLCAYSDHRARAKHPGSSAAMHLEIRLLGTRVVRAAVGRALQHLDRAWDRVRFHEPPSLDRVVAAVARRSLDREAARPWRSCASDSERVGQRPACSRRVRIRGVARP